MNKELPTEIQDEVIPHTTGPWHVHGGWGMIVKASSGKAVAECWRHDLVKSPDEIVANAKLIALAPEMLAVLRAVALPPYPDSDVGSLLETLRSQAQALLDKLA
jgi:hypothetical protein